MNEAEVSGRLEHGSSKVSDEVSLSTPSFAMSGTTADGRKALPFTQSIQPCPHLVVMRDPAGHPFCLILSSAARRS
jgi:hypothetical protein